MGGLKNHRKDPFYRLKIEFERGSWIYQGRFLNILILLLYFKWCWASDGATSNCLREGGRLRKSIENQKFRFLQTIKQKNQNNQTVNLTKFFIKIED